MPNKEIKIYLIKAYINEIRFIKVLIDNETIIKLILSKIMERINVKQILFKEKWSIKIVNNQ